MSSSSAQLGALVVRDLCEGSCLRNWKIAFAAILLVEGLLFAHIVYFLKKATGGVGRTFNTALRIGNAVSAGIFLSAGLLHIFPEAVELFAGGDLHGSHARMLGAGARVVSKLVREQDDEHHLEGEGAHEGEEAHSTQFPWAYLITALAYYLLFAAEKIIIPKLFPEVACDAAPAKDVEEQSDDNEQPAASAQSAFFSAALVQGLVQVAGISLHSLFESMALGISTSFDIMLNIFIATAAHRWATSIALSFKLIRKLGYFPFLLLMTLFSSAVPVGIGIGAALSSLSATTQGVLFALSAGTFLYIGAYELMAEEFVQHKSWQLRKFVFTLLGALVITIITVVLSVTGVHA